MSKETGAIGPEDYAEPRCLLCDEPYGAEKPVQPIPQSRIAQKLDECWARRDTAGAERLLLYWLREAELGRDRRGELFLSNELIGHYRKCGEKEKSLAFADRALDLAEKLGYAGTVTYGTTHVNAATACSAFGDDGRALALFRKARETYEAIPELPDHLLGGLYNNMGLTLTALGRYDEALALYEKALSVMGRVPGGTLEQAITCLNMADTVSARDGQEAGEERIFALVDRAWELLQDPAAPRNGYYAFVAEKCAPSFSYYGYFLAAKELTEEADRIYAGTGA